MPPKRPRSGGWEDAEEFDEDEGLESWTAKDDGTFERLSKPDSDDLPALKAMKFVSVQELEAATAAAAAKDRHFDTGGTSASAVAKDRHLDADDEMAGTGNLVGYDDDDDSDEDEEEPMQDADHDAKRAKQTL